MRFVCMLTLSQWDKKNSQGAVMEKKFGDAGSKGRAESALLVEIGLNGLLSSSITEKYSHFNAFL